MLKNKVNSNSEFDKPCHNQVTKENINVADDNDILERFIPISEADLIEDLACSEKLSPDEAQIFRRVADMLVTLYHARFHVNLKNLKASYMPFSPDLDTVMVRPISDDQRSKLLADLVANIHEICERANFEKLDQAALNEAMSKSSPYGVRVYVNLDEFQEIALYFRGSAIRRREVRDWRKLWLKKIVVETPIYRRLFLLLKPNEEQKGLANNKEVDERCVYLKLFKNIPQFDLETLFPNTKIKMSLFDKVKLGVTGSSGTLTGIFAFMAKAGSGAIGFVIALGGLLAVLWRQIANVFNHRNKYMATLAKNLYFYNLNNNMGAIAQLIDLAEGEDTKEAILAYYFLYAYADKNFDEAGLDKVIEQYIGEKYNIKIDFEVGDGLRKLKQLGLLNSEPSAALTVKSLEQSLKMLNDEWDDMYDYK